MMKRESIVKLYGMPGTYKTNTGGMGFGYKIAGLVYKSGGNGWYYKIDIDEFILDGGKKYRATVQGLCGY